MSSIAELMQLCRLCLVKDQVDVPIFEDSGDLHERCLKIAACLPVKVKKDDKLPKKICSGCSYKLDLLYQFYNTSASADKQLKTWLSQLEGGKTIEGEVSSKESLTKSEPSESGDAHSLSADAESYIMQQQKLPYQNVAFPFQEDAFVEPQPSSSGLAEETETRTPSKRKRKTIQTLPVPDSDEEDDPHSKIAKLENDSDSDNDNDNDNFIPDDTSDSEQPGPSGLGKVSGDTPRDKRKQNLECEEETHSDNLIVEFKCEPFTEDEEYFPEYSQNVEENSSSKKSFEVKDENTTDDISTSGEKILHCKICNKQFLDHKLFEKHQKKHLQDSIRIDCPLCHRKFKQKHGLKYHLDTMHKGETYEDPFVKEEFKCEHCPKIYTNEYNFLRHQKIHVLPRIKKMHKCPHCDSIFEQKAVLKDHVESIHLGIRYSCEKCDKVFVQKSYYKTHLKLHDPNYVKEVICPICNKLTTPTALKQHVKRHNKVKRICHLCGASFTKLETFNAHLNKHAGIKPYPCKICGKSFGDKRYLYDHEVTHTKEKKFVCEICDKKFAQRGTLAMHIKGHTGEKPFECSICSKKFISNSMLTSHKKKEHNVI